MRRLALATAVMLSAACAAPSPPPEAQRGLGASDVTLAVQPQPPIAGEETLIVFTVRRDDRLLGSGEGEMVADMPGGAGASPPIVLDNDGGGHWWTRYTFPRAGGWTASLRVRPRESEPIEASFSIDVAPP